MFRREDSRIPWIRVVCFAAALISGPAAGLAAAGAAPPPGFDLNAELQTRPGPGLPPLTRHGSAPFAEQAQAHAALQRNRREVWREKLGDKWFAALLTLDGPEPLAITMRFGNWSDLAGFIQTNRALVELWAEPAGAGLSSARRITAQEMTVLQKQEPAQPLFLTVTWRDPNSAQVKSAKVEFGLDAGPRALAALQQAKPGALLDLDLGAATQPVLAALHLAGAGVEPPMPGASPGAAQESGLGRVVERILTGADAVMMDGPAHAQVHTGPDAVEERYAQVLDDLLEWRRYLQRKALGTTLDTSEHLQAAGVLEDLASKGIWIDDSDALLSVDPFHNRFQYRRYIQGQPRVCEVSSVPARADQGRQVAKAEEARRSGQLARQALAAGGPGLIQVHRVQEINGRPELGPLLLNETSPEGIGSFLSLLDRLPAVDQARLRFEGYSRVLVSADLDGTGAQDRFFLTFDFPAGQTLRRERTNPLTGEREVLVEKDGLLVKVITDARVTETEYNAQREETASRTCVNTGTRAAPVNGSLLEETRTVETWQRDLAQAGLDPALPVLAKSKFNHVTGETSREIFGLFPFPVATVDGQSITYRQFNPYGVLVSAAVFDNGQSEAQFNRPLAARLDLPIVGRERFQLTSTLPQWDLPKLRDLKPFHYLTTLVRRDLLTGLTRTETCDNGHWGRKVTESFADPLDGTNTLPVNVTLEYSANFFHGQVPARRVERAATTGAILSQVETKSYDPLTRRTVGVASDYTGRTSTNLWDYRWSHPVEVQTAGRKTVHQYNHDETQVTGSTVVARSGEELSRFSGRFDAGTRHWRLQRLIWHSAGVTNQAQTATLSPEGRVLSIRFGELLEKRSIYSTTGVEDAVRVYTKSPVSGQFSVLQQQENEFRWQGGQRTARIQRYVDGHLYDSFLRASDPEGRTMSDERQFAPGLSLKTVIEYDGWTERPIKAEIVQNGKVRLTRLYERAERQADGSFIVPIRTVPSWGLAWVESLRPDDPFGRFLSRRFEEGGDKEAKRHKGGPAGMAPLQTLTVTQWYEGASIPRELELRDRYGHLIERWSLHANATNEAGIACDLIERKRVGFWGASAWVETRAVAVGTDLALFSRTAFEKVCYDLSQPFDLPLYAADLEGRSGRKIIVRDQELDHVLKLFRGGFEKRPEAVGSLLSLDCIDLRSSNILRIVQRTVDSAGRVLDERFSTAPVAKGGTIHDTALFTALAGAKTVERFHYRYQPGWLVEQPAAQGQGRLLRFSTRPPASGTTGFAVNEGASRDFVTGVDGIRPTPAGSEGVRFYFFRRLHSPVQREVNAFLPGCSNVWTSWRATELGPEGNALAEAELIYDASGRLSVSNSNHTPQEGRATRSVRYQLPEPDPQLWKRMHLQNPTNAFTLDLGGIRSLDGSDYIYFYLQTSAPMTWSALFRSSSGQAARLSPTAVAGKIGEVRTAGFADFLDPRWPETGPEDPAAWVGAPRSAAARQALVLASVADLAKAGLDITRLSGATIEVQGRPGDSLALSSVARLLRPP